MSPSTMYVFGIVFSVAGVVVVVMTLALAERGNRWPFLLGGVQLLAGGLIACYVAVKTPQEVPLQSPQTMLIRGIQAMDAVGVECDCRCESRRTQFNP